MKFLVVCICAMVAASSAGKMNKKRGIFGSPEADVMNNHVAEQHGFNDHGSNGGFDSGYQYNDYNGNNNHFGSSSHSDFHSSPLESTFNADSYSSGPQSNYNGASAHTSSYVNFPPNDNNNQYDHEGFNNGHSQDYSSGTSAGPSFNAAPAQSFDIPSESVRTRHSESIEKGRYPVQVPRTIVKTRHIERPVPQPYEVIKHVPQPIPVQRVRAVIKEVPVPQPFYINKEVVRQVPVERLIHKPVPVVKYVHVPVEHQVPVFVQNPEPVWQAPVAHHSVVAAPIAHQSLSASYGVPQSYALSHSGYGLPQTYNAAHSYGSSHSSYGLPQTYNAAHSYGSYGDSIAHAPLVAPPQGW